MAADVLAASPEHEQPYYWHIYLAIFQSQWKKAKLLTIHQFIQLLIYQFVLLSLCTQVSFYIHVTSELNETECSYHFLSTIQQCNECVANIGPVSMIYWYQTDSCPVVAHCPVVTGTAIHNFESVRSIFQLYKYTYKSDMGTEIYKSMIMEIQNLAYSWISV